MRPGLCNLQCKGCVCVLPAKHLGSHRCLCKKMTWVHTIPKG